MSCFSCGWFLSLSLSLFCLRMHLLGMHFQFASQCFVSQRTIKRNMYMDAICCWMGAHINSVKYTQHTIRCSCVCACTVSQIRSVLTAFTVITQLNWTVYVALLFIHIQCNHVYYICARLARRMRWWMKKVQQQPHRAVAVVVAAYPAEKPGKNQFFHSAMVYSLNPNTRCAQLMLNWFSIK